MKKNNPDPRTVGEKRWGLLLAVFLLTGGALVIASRVAGEQEIPEAALLRVIFYSLGMGAGGVTLCALLADKLISAVRKTTITLLQRSIINKD